MLGYRRDLILLRFSFRHLVVTLESFRLFQPNRG